MWRPSTLAKRFSRAQALPAEPGDRDKFSAVISGGWEDRCDIGHLATNILGRNLEGQIDDLNPLLGVDDAFAPHGVEIGEGLFRDSLLGGFSRRLQFLNAVARNDQHVPEFRE